MCSRAYYPLPSIFFEYLLIYPGETCQNRENKPFVCGFTGFTSERGEEEGEEVDGKS